MYINCAFELSVVLDSEKFEDIFLNCYCGDTYSEETDSEYIDRSLAEKGVVVQYRASQYKKKISLTIDVATVTGSILPAPEKLKSKLEKCIEKYFQEELTLDDFTLSGLILSTVIDVESRENVAAYLKVIRRIGKVKGFFPVDFDWLKKDTSFCLRGNSNGVDFLLYDLEQMIVDRLMLTGEGQDKIRAIKSKYKGILRTEVHLTKPKSIRKYTSTYGIADQIVELSEKRNTILMETFARVVPFGDFYKKDDATEIIRGAVKSGVVRRRMLRLLALIPEKKSLYLAQKAMPYRHPDSLLVDFARINLSPVTISKRQNERHLKNLYEYL